MIKNLPNHYLVDLLIDSKSFSYDNCPTVKVELIAKLSLFKQQLTPLDLLDSIELLTLNVWLQYVPTGSPINDITTSTVSTTLDIKKIQSEYAEAKRTGFKRPSQELYNAVLRIEALILEDMVSSDDLSDSEYTFYKEQWLPSLAAGNQIEINELSEHNLDLNCFHALYFARISYILDMNVSLNDSVNILPVGISSTIA